MHKATSPVHLLTGVISYVLSILEALCTEYLTAQNMPKRQEADVSI